VKPSRGHPSRRLGTYSSSRAKMKLIGMGNRHARQCDNHEISAPEILSRQLPPPLASTDTSCPGECSYAPNLGITSTFRTPTSLFPVPFPSQGRSHSPAPAVHEGLEASRGTSKNHADSLDSHAAHTVVPWTPHTRSRSQPSGRPNAHPSSCRWLAGPWKTGECRIH
jgi:hypothetical protein